MNFSKSAFGIFAVLVLVVTALTGCFTASVSSLASLVTPPFSSTGQSSKVTESLASNLRLQAELNDWKAADRTAAVARMSGIPKQPALHRELNFNGESTAATERDKKLTVNAVQMSLSTLLYALATESEMELELHEPLDSLVTFRAKDASLHKVLSRLARQTPLHWQIKGGVLHVWGDTSYTETYPINYLNISRSLSSSVGLATQVGTINSVDGASAGVSNSSETQIRNHAEQDFWKSLQSDIEVLLTAVDTQSSVSLNRDAGFITLHAGYDSHAALKVYLERLQSHSNRQVLIQASVIEVVLNDDFSAGIDWQVLGKGASSLNAIQNFDQSPSVLPESVKKIPSPAGLLSWIYSDKNINFQSTVHLLQRFGDVRIVSRPQMLALNNQSAVLKVVDNRVYFALDIERRRGDDRDEISTKTEIKTVPVGLVMHVTPFVGDNSTVMLNVRPTLSRILGFVNDPNPELAAASIKNSVPEIQVREMESVLQVQDGETAVIGGLIQDSTDNVDTRIPFLGNLPVLGSFFRSTQRIKKKSELVILIHPTVVS